MMGMLLLLMMMMMMKPIKISHSIKVTHELCTEYSYNRLLKRIRITKRIPERESLFTAHILSMQHVVAATMLPKRSTLTKLLLLLFMFKTI